MSGEIAAFKILNRLEWSHLALILGLLIRAPSSRPPQDS